MGGRRRLKGGKVRMLAHHGGEDGALFRRAYDALEAELGPFTTELLKLEASRAAADYVHMVGSSQARSGGRLKRKAGKGRRPSDRQVSGLGKRHGLDEGSWTQAKRDLQELACHRGRRPSSIAALAAAKRAQA